MVAGDLDLDGDEREQLRNGVARLRVPHRYRAAIGALAEAVRAGDGDRVMELLTAGEARAWSRRHPGQPWTEATPGEWRPGYRLRVAPADGLRRLGG